MDEIPEARFLGKDNMVFDVWYYYCEYIIYVVHVSYMMCAQVMLCIYSACTRCFCTVMYRVI